MVLGICGCLTRHSPVRVLVYSDNARTREQVMLALGKRIHPELPELSYLEVATAPMVIAQMDEGGIDLAILDGEATPAGGMGIAKQLKDEITRLPTDPGADRAGGRRVAGQLVTRRSRGAASDRPDSGWATQWSVCCAHPLCEPAIVSAPPHLKCPVALATS